MCARAREGVYIHVFVRVCGVCAVLCCNHLVVVFELDLVQHTSAAEYSVLLQLCLCCHHHYHYTCRSLSKNHFVSICLLYMISFRQLFIAYAVVCCCCVVCCACSMQYAVVRVVCSMLLYVQYAVCVVCSMQLCVVCCCVCILCCSVDKQYPMCICYAVVCVRSMLFVICSTLVCYMQYTVCYMYTLCCGVCGCIKIIFKKKKRCCLKEFGNYLYYNISVGLNTAIKYVIFVLWDKFYSILSPKSTYYSRIYLARKIGLSQKFKCCWNSYFKSVCTCYKCQYG